jgi:hypothetical protein
MVPFSLFPFPREVLQMLLPPWISCCRDAEKAESEDEGSIWGEVITCTLAIV